MNAIELVDDEAIAPLLHVVALVTEAADQGMYPSRPDPNAYSVAVGGAQVVAARVLALVPEHARGRLDDVELPAATAVVGVCALLRAAADELCDQPGGSSSIDLSWVVRELGSLLREAEASS